MSDEVVSKDAQAEIIETAVAAAVAGDTKKKRVNLLEKMKVADVSVALELKNRLRMMGTTASPKAA